ncbi:MAG: DUF3037 domain-containing protein [Enterococcus casseliflavus]|uniref:DUF3037 domain-containing protein n=1 Tax=Enterococcus casseliflavus TaxID=37734 RepID=UPI0018847409|nr:DUF3037 domain-containing protein [Enterococcus casseliflavus]MBE9878398.1 DUF3037 domain-containing protein [Enterococcus casseliflavus]MDU1982446.1 DUF3037 domain-containing protein [Enterococcus casseliflavus]MDU5814790.1 DUF3037 domain-containing protein [Enterococcus casseliflavus]
MDNSVKINYSICNYVPSVIRQESVIFGIVIHCPSEEYSEFFRTKNLKRLRAFDDEYDKDYMDLMAETFSYYFNYPSLDTEDYDAERFDRIRCDNFISNITKYYVNEFKFSETRELLSTKDELVADMNDLRRTYLYYDRPKSERITTPEVKRLLSKELKHLNLINYVKVPEIHDLADREIVDFEYNDTLVKILSFDYKRKADIVDQMNKFQIDMIENSDYFNSKKIKIVMGNSEFYDKQFMSSILNKLHKLNSNIEITPISEYTNNLVFQGLK